MSNGLSAEPGLGDANAAERRRRAAIAGFTDDTETARAAATDPNERVREAGVRSLVRLAALATHDLTAALNDHHPRVRLAALEVAAHRAEPPIAHHLNDPDPRVVEQAAWACGERDHQTGSEVIGPLCDLTQHHDDPLVREAAVAALGALGHPNGLTAILHATTDKPAVRRRAVLALAAFSGPEVNAAWERARHDRDRQVRDAVDELLGPA